MTNKTKILFFATMRTRAGRSSIELELNENTTVSELKNILVEQFPALEASLHHTLVSINRDFADDEEVIPQNAEIAIFPPVSGG